MTLTKRCILKKLTLVFVCAFMLSTSTESLAQLIKDAAGAAISMHYKSTFKDLPLGDIYNDNQFGYQTNEYWLPIPLLKIGKFKVLGTVNYKKLNFEFDKGFDPTQNHLSQIEEFKSVVVVRRAFGQRWGGFGVLIPTIASDFKAPLNHDDFIMDAIFGVSRKFGERSNLEISIGPHVLYYFGKFLITPGVAVDYKTKQWTAQFFWPRLNVLRNFGNNRQLGIAGSIDWTLHNVKDYTNHQGQKIAFAQFSAMHGGVQFNQRLFDNFWIQLQGGVSFLNKYTLLNAQHDTINHHLGPETLYAKAMLTYRFGK
jgi:hypothetical protein